MTNRVRPRGAWSRLALILAPLALTGMGNRPLPPTVEDDVQRFNRVLLEFFRPHFMLPIAIPAGQAVGDVYEFGTWVLAERARTCFPGLVEPRTGSTSLPAVTRVAASHVGFALGLDRLLDLQGAVGTERAVEMRFRDVRYSEVAKGDLRRTLSTACEQLRPVVEEQRDRIEPGRPPPVVIGRLISGRKQVFVGLRDTGEVAARADALKAALTAAGGGAVAAALPVEVRAAVEGEFGSRRGLVVETVDAVPIAFQPAFIIDVYAALKTDRALQSGTGAGGPAAPPAAAWTAFDPGTSADHREIFDSLTGTYLMVRR